MENNETFQSNPTNIEITLKIKTFNKDFEIKISKNETIKKLKQIIEEVNINKIIKK